MKTIFETENYIVRDYKFEDWKTVHELVAPFEMYEFQHWGPNSEEDTKGFINMCLDQQTHSPRLAYELSVTDKSGEIVAAIGLRVIGFCKTKGEIGYWVKKDLWGQGIATEITKGILKFGFETLNLNKISATASPNNPGSIKVLEKAGLTNEGYLKDDLLIRGDYRDSVLMAIIKSEYK